MPIWFWLNIPLMLLFLGCWAGIPMWHTLQRWDAELKAKHAEIAARAAAHQPVTVGSVPAQASSRTTESQTTASSQPTASSQTTASSRTTESSRTTGSSLKS